MEQKGVIFISSKTVAKPLKIGIIVMDLKIIFILVTCVVYAAATEPAATVTLQGLGCDSGCIQYEVYCQQDEDDHPYQQKASEFCQSRSIGRGPAGRLAVLNHKYIDGEIRDLIKSNKLHRRRCIKNYGFWIGLSDSKREGTFFWDNGEMAIGQREFSNWASRQPNNNRKLDGEGQDCVQMWYRNGRKGQWDDEYCDVRPKGFVCEVPDPYCATLARN
ncbi:perlucin-like protein [Ptychodera flava]|uniref:perlucin-like protein n=1 Tax=Ptychodera flava TaxID=63121 RepID=UPI00396A4B9D